MAGAKVGAAALMCMKVKIPHKHATDDACRTLLEHHAAVLATLDADPAALFPAAAIEHCTNFGSKVEASLSPLSLCPYHLDPSFLWAPSAARSTLISWARSVYLVHQATMSPSFAELPDDIAGDVFEFLESPMSRTELMHITTHCSSPEARNWVHALIEVAVVVRFVVCYK